jgi:hypothetical protein
LVSVARFVPIGIGKNAVIVPDEDRANQWRGVACGGGGIADAGIMAGETHNDAWV